MASPKSSCIGSTSPRQAQGEQPSTTPFLQLLDRGCPVVELLLTRCPLGGRDVIDADLEPGNYTVYVNQFALPAAATSQKYTLHTWLICPDSKPDHAATAAPAEQPASMGGKAEVTVSWKGLPTGHFYVGLVQYGDGTDTVGNTFMTVAP
ncbi:hypothetical protein QQM39_39785 [Streptomyces sp. DT2A-34]|uniref:hypothetical protein n=1 Tax=Streptomyces sp. DT2A-34 TaxID=3051182 RepID=UPI00265BEBD6|nr:hypothetical protein [Streptomyces sp. DT2A-34]MDO0916740.1 hypothetical protein [Streptomyces sp. DT2A-34]